MSTPHQKYCLDANVLIQAWQKYYSPKFCPDYWSLLNQLGIDQKIFIPQMVYEEIIRTEDELAEWLRNSNIPIHKIDGHITECLKRIYEFNPIHQYLVANSGQHSLADPWLIAHAINQNAVVVTKEIKDNFNNPTKIKIPHVCDNMGIRWINDFELVEELGIHFKCFLK
jgi:predicted nucleic acid-binding protein